MTTEFAFTLPRGWIDASGQVHREGTMRLATARDEIEPQADPEVQRNEAYLAVLLLSRVVTRLGGVTQVTPALIADLFAADFDHLQTVYAHLNAGGDAVGAVACPACGHGFEVDLTEVSGGDLVHG
ncbi:MAG: hypothetical protein J7513_11550 [Solirubrobacteraceae bacterium]|nr:hypothetical protein [Solirubrobacteraceae bacterium]